MFKELLCLACLVFLLKAQPTSLSEDVADISSLSSVATASPFAGVSGFRGFDRAIASPPPVSAVEKQTVEKLQTIDGIRISRSSYSLTNQIWTTLQSLNGGCCNKCNEICGFYLKVKGIPYYLTNEKDNTYRYENSGPAKDTQIYKLSQNVDCTWSIIDSSDHYVVMDPKSKDLVAKSEPGPYGRWYLERTGDHVQIQNAWTQYQYISFKFGFPKSLDIEGVTQYRRPLIFEMCFVPCDKKAWWNLPRKGSSPPLD